MKSFNAKHYFLIGIIMFLIYIISVAKSNSNNLFDNLKYNNFYIIEKETASANNSGYYITSIPSCPGCLRCSNSSDNTFLTGINPSVDLPACVTGEAVYTYNCVAWSLGISYDYFWDEIDEMGNNNGFFEIEEFDDFYSIYGYSTVDCGGNDVQIRLYAKINPNNLDQYEVMHVDLKIDSNTYESKCGDGIRIRHDEDDLRGSNSNYGTIQRCYGSVS